MEQKQKMVCATCGVEMNHHAEKVDYSSALTDPGPADLLLGGIVEEVHTCPGCGEAKIRHGS